MIIEFSDGLKKQDIYANGDELAQILGFDRDDKGNKVYSWPKDKKVHVAAFNNPVLVTDNFKIAQLDSVKRDTLFALFSAPIKTTMYCNTSLDFEQKKYPGVWGPSIDTLLFCRALRKANLDFVKTAVEVGSGSGFISKFIINNSKSLKKINLIDLNSRARDCAKASIKDKRAKFFAGNAIKFLEKKQKYDLVMCNPPYIPRPKSIDVNPYEGLSLLVFLIKNAKRLLNENGVFITNISSLCWEMIVRVVKEAGVTMKVIDSMEVPLKVYNVLNNKEWMDYLLKKGLKKEAKEGYDYWQTINIVVIMP